MTFRYLMILVFAASGPTAQADDTLETLAKNAGVTILVCSEHPSNKPCGIDIPREWKATPALLAACRAILAEIDSNPIRIQIRGPVDQNLIAKLSEIREAIPALSIQRFPLIYLGAKFSPHSLACVIVDVIEESPAAKSGLRSRDTIVRIDDTTIGRYSDLRQALCDYLPGATAKLAILRDGKQITTEVTFSQFPPRLPNGG